MNWDELKSAWTRQTAPALAGGSMKELEREFVAKQRRRGRTLFWRDIREAAAGVLVAAVFARTAWAMGAAGWPIGFAVLLLLGQSGFFVRERFRARQRMAPVDTPLLPRLEVEIREQERQLDLLRNVGRWYVAPLLAAAVIFGATVVMNAPVPWIGRLIAGAAMAAILALGTWVVIHLNRYAAERVIAPALEELRSQRAQLLKIEV